MVYKSFSPILIEQHLNADLEMESIVLCGNQVEVLPY